MFRFRFGDTVESILTVYGTNYLLLEMEENVKEMKIDRKEVNDDSTELKKVVRDLRGEEKNELGGIKGNLQAAASAETSKWLKLFLPLMIKYSLAKLLRH